MTDHPTSTVLVTGASTGIGNLTARALAGAGHTVYAGIRDAAGRNAARAADLVRTAATHGGALRVVDLDVTSQASADAAAQQMIAEVGHIDAVVHNAGHLHVGYVEAFTAEDIAALFDVNVLGAHRVNRAVLPHLRARATGTLIYVGSTTTVSVPPFLGPYVASKFAFDGYAQTLRYELHPLGIETTIVMPGAFTTGTDHFANATPAADDAVAKAYARLDPLVTRNEEATAALIDPGAHPGSVAAEIVRVLALPTGDKPLRTVVDFTGSHVADVNDVAEAEARAFLTRLGFADLLSVRRTD